MTLEEYVNQRLDEGGANTMIAGLQNNVRCYLPDAVNNVPAEDWISEITARPSESEGERLIWLAGRSDPSCVIQD